MAGPAPLFREIHRLRRYGHDLQEQLDRIPRQLKAHQQRVARQEEALRQAQDAIRKLKVTTSDREKELKAWHAKIARYGQQLGEATGKKEYDALQLEIAHARTECDRLEDEGLQALGEIDEKTAELPGLEKALAQAREDLARLEAQIAPRKADLEAQLAGALTELKAVEEQIPDDLRPQYNRTIASLGPDGMAAVVDRSCTACNTAITAQAQFQLDQELFLVCRSCGRILYQAARTADEEEDEPD